MLIACVIGEAFLGVTSAALIFWNRSRKNVAVYIGALLCFVMFTMWIRVSPLELTCEELVQLAYKSDSGTFDRRAEILDCGAQGRSLALLGASVIFLMPHIVPQFRMMVAMSAYLVIYIVLICWYMWRHFEVIYYTWIDLFIEFTILLCTFVGSLYKKFFMEKQQLAKYKLQHGKGLANNRLFGVLKYMLPQHVLGRVLRFPGEPIADRVDCASILFIEIVGFEQQVKYLPPEQLLAFLNRLFTKFDDICKMNCVTKIETVGQEYVAAVGVSPEDVEVSERGHHQDILGRLIDAATIILKLQSRYSVQFKMGIHTGAVVAGVIGQKLPRFRLFGDTINTAARMMQKGVNGRLQFGEHTKVLLPPGTEVEHRGPIEMKGKGKVEVYLLAQPGNIGLSDGETSAGDVSAGEGEVPVRTSRDAPERQGSDPAILAELGKEVGKNSLLMGLPDNSSSGTPSMVGTKSSVHSSDTKKEVTCKFDGSLAAVVPIDTFEEMQMKPCNPSWRFCRVARVFTFMADCLYRKFGLDDVEFASPEERQVWLKKFYNTQLYSQVAIRTDQQTTVIAFVTAFEGFTALTSGAADEPHNIYGRRRMWVFFLCRTATVAVILAWRNKIARGGAFRTPKITEWWRLLDLCFSFLMYFFAYDALMFESTISVDMTAQEIRTTHEMRPYRIALWPLMFALSYMSLLVDLRVRLQTAVIFVIYTQLLLAFVSLGPFNFHLMLSMHELYGFLCLGLLGLALALHDERRSLAEFDATRSIDAVGERISFIVNTLMPPFVVAELEGSTLHSALPSHHYRSATVLQSDLVGFTKLSSTLNPEEVVKVISDLFRLFDDVTDKYKVYKVETVGDAYIAGQAGMPLTQTNRPLSVSIVATEMVRITQEWSASRGVAVKCRVGVHTDECTGGIVGLQMQRYHLFGKLLSVVETLESTAPEGRVQISSACKEAIDLQIKQEKLPLQVITMQQRKESQLSTSKGDIVDYEDAGGFPTYIVEKCCLDQYIVT
eukprot:TRINITY_DN13389_c2_g2_i1.p1 TRINITY_DN13389_c2_g2~~TRINITY_DN13389_c2_g2_i1.p1  ORF type:complete len:1178 (-),score=235.14 TRINITY_DN13389_c2_g2_i1:98-3103(-)